MTRRMNLGTQVGPEFHSVQAHAHFGMICPHRLRKECEQLKNLEMAQEQTRVPSGAMTAHQVFSRAFMSDLVIRVEFGLARVVLPAHAGLSKVPLPCEHLICPCACAAAVASFRVLSMFVTVRV